MSLSLFVGLMIFVSVNAQVLRPRCSNPQGIYVAEEGRPLSVCFTMINGALDNLNVIPSPQTVYFITKSESNLGVVATNDIDYVNENRTVDISLVDLTQDVLEICQPIVINSDKLTERTEYFTVSLHRAPLGLQVAACQVAILDKNGGPSECYDTAVTGVDVGLSTIINDTAYCLTGNSNYSQTDIKCQQDPNLALADCTSWNPTSLNNVMTTFIVLDQILPTVSAISGACAENVISGLDTLYRGENGDIYAPSSREECATNCVLTVRNDQTCATSVLLLEQVQRQEARKFLNEMKNGRLDLCMVGLDCCDLSQPIPSTCSEQSPLPSSETGVNNEASGAVIAIAVLGAIFGLLLLIGIPVLILFLLYKHNSAVHKELISALQAVKLQQLTKNTSKVDSEVKANTVDCRVAESQETVEYNVADRVTTRSVRMKDNNAYIFASRDGISIESNVAYFTHNLRMKSAYDDDDYMYDYI